MLQKLKSLVQDKSQPLTGKEAILNEIRRCKSDPAYFARNYIYIKDKERGAIKFKLWDFQEKVLKDFQNNRLNIILKARQLGMTELMAMYVLWFALFQKDKTIVIVSKHRKAASDLVKRVKYAYKKLPQWLKIAKLVSDNVHTVEFDNDSVIFADSSTENAGRGIACSLFIVDEAAFIPTLEEMWASVFPSIDNGGSCIVGSTPNGAAGQFYNLYQDAPKNGFNPIKLDWDSRPDRDQEWYEKTKLSMSPKKFSQEFLCVSGNARVFTKDGFKQIQDINIGDQVLTHQGRFRKVLKTYKNTVTKNEVMTITSPLSRGFSFEITKNHPILTAEKIKDQKTSKMSNIRAHIKNGSYVKTWRSLDEIDLRSVVRKCENGIFPKYQLDETYLQKIIDFANYNIHCELDNLNIRYENQWGWNKRFINLDYDFGKILGLFLSEGSYQEGDKKISFAFHSDETDLINFVTSFMDKYDIKYHINFRIENAISKSNCTTITTNNKFLNQLFKDFIIGRYCYEKYLNEKCFDFDKNIIKGIIDGVWLGDATHKLNKKYVLSITSEKLIYQLRILMSSFNCITRLAEKDLTIYNPRTLPQFYLELNGANYSSIEQCTENGIDYENGARTIFADNIWWGRPEISTYLENDNLDVYNIEVEQDNSYCLLGLIVHNCSFLLSGDTVIDGEDIERHEKNIEKSNTNRKEIGPGRDLWIWKDYDHMHRYCLGADVARGDGEDYSAFTVLDFDTGEIVCEYKGKIKVDRFAELLVTTANNYGGCLVVVENNSYGLAVLMKLIDLRYPNIYWQERGTQQYREGYVDFNNDDDVVPGFTTTQRSRFAIVDNLEESFRLNKVCTYSPRMITEMRNFVYENGKPKARKGSNDDLIMALSITLFVSSLIFSNRLEDYQMKTKLLENFRLIENHASTRVSGEAGFDRDKTLLQIEDSDPYKFKIKNETIDFRFLVGAKTDKKEEPIKNEGIVFLGYIK